MTKRTVLVTGGAGYIGSVLTNKLLDRSYRIRIFDAGYFGFRHLPKHPHVEVLKGDLRRANARIFKNIESVIHLAGLSNDPMANFAPKLNYEINTKATIRLGQIAQKQGIKRFIFASSCSIYHNESSNRHLCTEQMTVRPTAHYSRSKFLAERELLKLGGQKLAITIVRMGTVGGYSPRMRFDLAINTMVKSAISEGKIYVISGKQDRPLIDVQDVVDAYEKILIASSSKIDHEIFNLSYDNYRILDLAKTIARIFSSLNHPVILVESAPKNKVRSYKVSTDKIRRILGIRPNNSASETVKSLFKQLKANKIEDFNNPIYYNIAWTKLLLKSMKQKNL